MNASLVLVAALAVGPLDHPCSCHGGVGTMISGFGYTSSCVVPPDMPPRTVLLPSYHGNYYFRGYHHTHVIRQRALAERFGDDPRNPYANRVFLPFYRNAESR